MKLKRLLSILIISSVFFVGCSSYQLRDPRASLPDEATKQKTMTKVQNDINEIMNKDYDYVLSNLGQPDATAYWIDKDDINNLNRISDFKDITDINLVYLKDVSGEDSNSSALYLQLINKEVKKVQIADYSSSTEINNLNQSKILINCYRDGDVVNLKSIEDKNLDDFIGINVDEISKIVGNKKVSYNLYTFNKDNKIINAYKLDNNKLLTVFVENNKISNIEIGDTNNIIDKIKDEVIDK